MQVLVMIQWQVVEQRILPHSKGAERRGAGKTSDFDSDSVKIRLHSNGTVLSPSAHPAERVNTGQGPTWLIIVRPASGSGAAVSISVKQHICEQPQMRTYRISEMTLRDNSCSGITESSHRARRWRWKRARTVEMLQNTFQISSRAKAEWKIKSGSAVGLLSFQFLRPFIPFARRLGSACFVNTAILPKASINTLLSELSILAAQSLLYFPKYVDEVIPAASEKSHNIL